MMQGVDIKRVEGERPIGRLADLAREIWTEHYVPIIGQAQVDYMLRRFQSEEAIAEQVAQGYEYYIARQTEQDCGYFCLVEDRNAHSVQLSKIYVRKQRRRSGVGQAIMEFVDARCTQGGAHTVWLTVNRHNAGSIVFYERMGFVKAGEWVTDIGNGFVMDDYRMVKECRTY